MVLFAVTVLMIGLIVVTLLPGIGHLSHLERVSDTIDKVVNAARGERWSHAAVSQTSGGPPLVQLPPAAGRSKSRLSRPHWVRSASQRRALGRCQEY